MCAVSCPKNAIRMTYDRYGFKYPTINEGKCVDCCKCLKECPYKSNDFLHEPQKGYVAFNIDNELIMKSSSGGVFSALAWKFIEEGGCVCGARYDFENKPYVFHEIIDKKEMVSVLQGSKYAKSDLGGICLEIERLLKSNKKILFCGTPCQVASVKRTLKKEYDGLFCIDLICHGVPAEGIFESYVEYLKKRNKKQITDISFRDKMYGWGKFGSIHFSDGGKVPMFYGKSAYYTYFMDGALQRENCYTCPYACSSRVSDITIGDYWFFEKYHPELLKDNVQKRGVSEILINTERGEELINTYGGLLQLKESNISDILSSNTQLNRPVNKNKTRNLLYLMYSVGGYKMIELAFIFKRIRRKTKYVITKLTKRHN